MKFGKSTLLLLALAFGFASKAFAHINECDKALATPTRLQELLQDRTDDQVLARLKPLLAGNVSLRAMFAHDAGVSEGFTIEEHTLMVLEKMRQQLPFLMPHLPADFVERVDLENLLRFAVFLHDIGKPVAIIKGNKDMQHKFTTPIIAELADSYQLTEEQKRILLNLTGTDVIGEFIKGEKKLAFTEEKLRKLAAFAQVEPGLYFQLQTFFYVIDASSYPYLRKKLFIQDGHGPLTFRQTNFTDLVFAFAR